jgi:hypothetical protein
MFSIFVAPALFRWKANQLSLALLPTVSREDTDVGVIRAGDRCYDEYRECVDRITQRGYARFPA